MPSVPEFEAVFCSPLGEIRARVSRDGVARTAVSIEFGAEDGGAAAAAAIGCVARFVRSAFRGRPRPSGKSPLRAVA